MAATAPIITNSIQLLVGGLLNTAQVIKDLKDAPTEIDEFGADVEILSNVLMEFQDAVETAIPSIAETKKQQSSYETAKQLIKRIDTIVRKMTTDSNLLSTATRSKSFFQQFLAKIKWLSGKSAIAMARQTIHTLYLSATLFVASVLCKSLNDRIAELEKNRAEVPAALSLKL